MDIRSHRNQVQSSNPLSDIGWGADEVSESSITQSQILTAGALDVESATVRPDPVLPGGQVTVTATVVERTEFVTSWDPDTCDPPNSPISAAGIRGELVLEPDWTQDTNEVFCIEVSTLRNNRREFTFTFRAPDLPEDSDGEIRRIGMTLRLPGSGQESETQQFEFAVASRGSGGQQGCLSDADCGSGMVCSAGQCVPEGTGPGNGGGDPLDGIFGGRLGQIQSVLLLLVIFVVVVQVAGD